MSDLQRAKTPMHLPELGQVYVRDVSMGLGMRLAQAIEEVPDETFTPFPESLQPLYREIVADCVVDASGNKVFADTKQLDGLGFKSFMLLVKTARGTMFDEDQPELEQAKKN